MPIRKVPNKRSPYFSLAVGDVSFSIGTETSNAITVSLQLKDNTGRDLAVRGRVSGYLSSDANGDALASSPEGVASGTDGLLIPSGASRATELIRKGTLVVDAVPEKFKTTTIAAYSVAGVVYTKAATTAIVFTAAHTITASKFGVILIQIDSAGTVSTKVPSATQAYNSAPLALADLPAPDAGKVALGYIAIANNTGDWVANTDDLTNGSDLTTAAFTDGDEATTVARSFNITSESDGDIDVVITDTRAPRTYYIVIVLGDGTLKVSDAITFA